MSYNKLKILFLCNEYPPADIGGIGRFTQTISNWLVNQNHEVHVAGIYKGIDNINHSIYDGVNVWRLNSIQTRLGHKFDFIYNLFRFRILISRIIKTYGINLIEGPNYGNSLLFIPKVTPIICRIHSSGIILRKIDNLQVTSSDYLNNLAAKNATHFVAVSEYIKKLAKINWHPVKNKSIKVIHNPINLKFFDKNQLGEKNKNWIVFVGTIGFHKGVMELILSWINIHFLYPHLSLQIFGKPGSCFQQVEKLAMNKEYKIFIHGATNLDGLVDAYGHACLAVFPSHFEAEGLAAKEAAASGVPLVLSNIPPYKEVFKEFPQVIYFEHKNINSLTKALKTAINELPIENEMSLVVEMEKYRQEEIGRINENYYFEILSKYKKR